ncbi:MAG: Asp-tRNA(Asn)/Glu-tRNA(Gln) amidotransferase subunit GatB [Fibrobacterales bacterium]
MSAYTAVMGLEVHTQLNTKTKLFCSCKREFGAEPNTHVCPVCLGMPGTLPIPNKEAINLAIRIGLALNCEIDPEPMWTRKNYFYPDLPKGYQITQTGGLPIYDRPVCKNGHLDIELEDGSTKRIRINRIHLEEDPSKLTHDLTADDTHVDSNRCGTPLCEIVTEPDLRSPKEAVKYLEKLKQILEYSGVSDADMEKGNLRADSNVSIRKGEDAPLGIRAEIKNLNSFTNLEKASNYEIELQEITLSQGKEVEQCTKRWDDANNKTLMLRSKENAEDYKYFPEPDLVRLVITEEMIQKARDEMPELPEAKYVRYQKDFGLGDYDAKVLIADKLVAHYFDSVAQQVTNYKLAANWIISEVLREAKEGIDTFIVTPDHLAQMINLIDKNTISGKIAKTVFAEIIVSGKMPEVIIKEKDLVQVTDTGAIKDIVMTVIEANQGQFDEFKSGKDKLRGFFVGQVMKQSKGKANPGMVNQILDELIA